MFCAAAGVTAAAIKTGASAETAIFVIIFMLNILFLWVVDNEISLWRSCVMIDRTLIIAFHIYSDVHNPHVSKIMAVK